MASYRYKVLQGGAQRVGAIQANSLQEASAVLRKEGGVILQLRVASADGRKPTSTKGASSSAFALPPVLARLLIQKTQVEITLRQLGSLLTAGIPILTALRAVGEQAPPQLSRVYEEITEKVRRGYPLKRCLQEEAPFLGKVTIGLVHVGEANGTLDEMFTYSAQLMERARKVRNQIIQAFTYPAIVVLAAFGVGYFMVAHVFPKIMVFIEKQGKEVQLPMPARVLIQVNDFLAAYGVYVLVAPFALVVAFILARRVPALGAKIDYALLCIPLLGRAFREHANTMWCRTLGALLGSGVDVLVALQLVQEIVGNIHYSNQFEQVKEVVRQGGALAKGIRATTLGKLSPIALTMVAVTEEGGGLDTSLLQVAEYSEEELTRRVAMLGKLVEPAVFIVVGGMVGFIYFAFFLSMLAVTRSAH